MSLLGDRPGKRRRHGRRPPSLRSTHSSLWHTFRRVSRPGETTSLRRRRPAPAAKTMFSVAFQHKLLLLFVAWLAIWAILSVDTWRCNENRVDTAATQLQLRSASARQGRSSALFLETRHHPPSSAYGILAAAAFRRRGKSPIACVGPPPTVAVAARMNGLAARKQRRRSWVISSVRRPQRRRPSSNQTGHAEMS